MAEQESPVDHTHVDILLVNLINSKLFSPLECFDNTIDCFFRLFTRLVKHMLPKPEQEIRVQIYNLPTSSLYLETYSSLVFNLSISSWRIAPDPSSWSLARAFVRTLWSCALVGGIPSSPTSMSSINQKYYVDYVIVSPTWHSEVWCVSQETAAGPLTSYHQEQLSAIYHNLIL